MTNNLNPDEIDMLVDTIAEAVAARFAACLNPEREIMDTPQAAAYLGVSTQFLEIARSKGGGPAFVKWARIVKYRKAALDDFLLENEHQNTVPAKFGYNL